MPPDNDFFQRTGFGESKTFFGGLFYFPYMMGLGQGNRAAPPSWIQLSAAMTICTYIGKVGNHVLSWSSCTLIQTLTADKL